jgi:hypothetical protein
VRLGAETKKGWSWFRFEMALGLLVRRNCWEFLCNFLSPSACFEFSVEWLEAKAEVMIKERIQREKKIMMLG